MVHAHAALPRFAIDAKRIAATSGVIALHVGVLMMLMVPARVAQTDVAEEPEMQVLVPRIIPRPLPLPPKPVEPRPVPVNVAKPVPVPIAEPPVEVVDQTPNAMSQALVETPDLPDSFDPPVASGTVFAQLAADVAPPPPYPRTALQRRIQGTVVLRIHVDASGRPLRVSVENSSGSLLLDRAAAEFVKARWHFVPATRDGAPVDAWALVPIEFVL